MNSLSRILRVPNWKYAVGELALIVSGILIALGANSWYEGRQVRQDEIQVLNQISQSLGEDYETLLDRTERITRFATIGDRLYDFLESDESIDDTYLAMFSVVNGFAAIQFQFAPFEALRSKGFDLVSNESLRLGLIELYDALYTRVEANIDRDAFFVNGQIRPFLMKEFRRDPSDAWHPKDLNAVRDDGYLANMSKMRAFYLKEYTLPSLEEATKANRDLRERIERVIGNTDEH